MIIETVILQVDPVVELYTQPRAGGGGAARYGSTDTLQPGDRVDLPVTRGHVLGISVGKLLP